MSRIRVEYIIDPNGMVTATATDKVSGQSKSVSVDYKKGMKPDSMSACRTFAVMATRIA